MSIGIIRDISVIVYRYYRIELYGLGVIGKKHCKV